MAGGRKALRARLNLVDLAGSERATAASGGGAMAETHKREMGHINKSLSTLANCIAASAGACMSRTATRS